VSVSAEGVKEGYLILVTTFLVKQGY